MAASLATLVDVHVALLGEGVDVNSVRLLKLDFPSD